MSKGRGRKERRGRGGRDRRVLWGGGLSAFRQRTARLCVGVVKPRHRCWQQIFCFYIFPARDCTRGVRDSHARSGAPAASIEPPPRTETSQSPPSTLPPHPSTEHTPHHRPRPPTHCSPALLGSFSTPGTYAPRTQNAAGLVMHGPRPPHLSFLPSAFHCDPPITVHPNCRTKTPSRASPARAPGLVPPACSFPAMSSAAFGAPPLQEPAWNSFVPVRQPRRRRAARSRAGPLGRPPQPPPVRTKHMLPAIATALGGAACLSGHRDVVQCPPRFSLRQAARPTHVGRLAHRRAPAECF